MKRIMFGLIAVVCMGCAHESVPVNTPVSMPVSKPVVTVKQLDVIVMGESVDETVHTWYTEADKYADAAKQKAEELKLKAEQDMAKLKAAIEAAVHADVCVCAQGDPLCSCL
jgi:hypothetical protein